MSAIFRELATCLRNWPIIMIRSTCRCAAPDAFRRAARRKPPLSGFWDTVIRDMEDLPADLWHDAGQVYGRPTPLMILGASYAGALALQEAGPDDTVEHSLDRPDQIYSSGWSDAFGAIGNPAVHFGLAGLWYLVGQQQQDDKTYEVGRTLFSALAINGASTLLGQAATYDDAPNGEHGSFPSGHTSSAFVVASVMHEAYGPWVGGPLYALATLAGIQRLDSREHYLSDVVFGAVLGTLVGHSVAGGRDPEIFGWQIVPYVDPMTGSTGIALHKSF